MAAREEIVLALTGGCGFVGSHVCDLLLSGKFSGVRVKEIRILDLKPPNQNHLLRPWLDEPSPITFIQGSISDRDALQKAFEGADAVLHLASLIDFGNQPANKLMLVNYIGTKFVIDAAVAAKAKVFVYTSSLATVTPWGECHNLGDDAPTPAKPEDIVGQFYGYSKSLAEKDVVEANSDRMRTCALRFRGLYGDGDPYYIVNVLRTLRSGDLVVKVGSSSAVVNHIYVGNVAYSHLVALERLLYGEDADEVAGQVFTVPHEEPMNFFDFNEKYAKAFGYSMPTRFISYEFLRPLVGTLERVLGYLPRSVRPQLTLTSSSLCEVCVTHTYDGSRFEKMFDYTPMFSLEKSTERTMKWLKEVWMPEEQKRLDSERFTRVMKKLPKIAILIGVVAYFVSAVL